MAYSRHRKSRSGISPELRRFIRDRNRTEARDRLFAANLATLDAELAAWCNAQDGTLTGQPAAEPSRENPGSDAR